MRGPQSGQMVYSRANPSRRYRELVALYQQMHVAGDPLAGIAAGAMFAGYSLLPYLSRIKQLVVRTGARSLLDYGSGKGAVYLPRDISLPHGEIIPSVREYLGVDRIVCYDPGVHEFMQLPAEQFDGVIATDVLEHCPEEDMPWIVEEIFSKARKFVFANVASYPAVKKLPNGENAHCTVRPAAWWNKLVASINARHPDVQADLAVAEAPLPRDGGEALFARAAALHQAKRLTEAIAIYQRLVRDFPGIAKFHNALGIALFETRRVDEAVRSMKAALSLDPSVANGDFNLAAVLQSAGRLEEACGYYERALAQSPGDLPALQNLAVALTRLGRCHDAAERYRQIVALRPDYAEGHLGLGAALHALGQTELAIESYARAVAARPNYFEAHIYLGNALVESKRPDQAADQYRRAVQIGPRIVAAHLKLAETLGALNRREEAVASYRAALALEPDNVNILTAIGNELRALDRFDEAVNCHARAVALAPSNGDLQRNLGITYFVMEENARALQCLDKALAIRPDDADAAAAKGLLYLGDGRFAEGWALFDRRFQRKAMDYLKSDYTAPRWDGNRLDGRLLVWGEQGLGDQILYASMITEARERVGAMVLELESRLVPLFARSFPDVEVIAMKPELYAGPISAHIPISGLGAFFRTKWEDFPRRQGYLRADEERARMLRERLAPDGRKLIGLSWRSFHRDWGANKSAELADFQTVLRRPDIRFVDLQYGDTGDERAALARSGIDLAHLDEVDNTNDIDALAALVAACDGILSVSNTTVHLAGALGKPVWLLVPCGQGRLWYWFKERDTSPWYPSVRVYRQQRGRSWASFIPTAAKDLVQFAGRSGD